MGRGQQLLIPLIDRQYYRKVLGYSPLAYWPLWEAGGSVAEELVHGWDGAYTGVTLGQAGIGDGHTAPLFDGANDYCDIYSVALSNAFDWNAGSAAIWARVFNVGVWTDGADRRAMYLGVDNNNLIYLCRDNTNNQIGYGARFGSVSKGQWPGGHSELGWMHMVITWDTAADEVWAYFNGALVDGVEAGLGVHVGTFGVNITNIGAYWHTGEVWYGYLAHGAVWAGTVLTPTQAADLAVVP